MKILQSRKGDQQLTSYQGEERLQKQNMDQERQIQIVTQNTAGESKRPSFDLCIVTAFISNPRSELPDARHNHSPRSSEYDCFVHQESRK